MLRLILGVALGLAAGMLSTAVLEAAGHYLYPPPAGVDFTDPAVARDAVALLHLGAKIALLVAWAGGVLVGATVANLVAQRRGIAGWIVAVVLAAFAGAMMVQIPHPLWMPAAALVLDFAAAYLAWRLFGRPVASGEAASDPL